MIINSAIIITTSLNYNKSPTETNISLIKMPQGDFLAELNIGEDILINTVWLVKVPSHCCLCCQTYVAWRNMRNLYISIPAELSY